MGEKWPIPGTLMRPAFLVPRCDLPLGSVWLPLDDE